MKNLNLNMKNILVKKITLMMNITILNITKKNNNLNEK